MTLEAERLYLYAIVDGSTQNNGHLSVTDARYINVLKLFLGSTPPLELMAARGFYHTLYMSQFKGKGPAGSAENGLATTLPSPSPSMNTGTQVLPSIACGQVGPISFNGKSMDAQEEMFNERISVLFKKLRVVRMLDRKRNVLVYLTYSDKLIDGSPQNGVTAVALGSVPLPPQ